MCKRFLDILLSLIGLVLFAPVMALIALGLRLEGPGNVIFAQERIGKGNTRFKVLKFRKFPAHWSDAGPGVTVTGDARMTPLGGILERTKLDELPQLWNIFRGDMSVVGPRPETPRFGDLFAGEFARVLDYTPGIFGPNQIKYRNESGMYPPDIDPEQFYREELFPAKAQNDLDYFSHANCIKDIAWFFRGAGLSLLSVIPWQRVVGLHVKIMLLDIALIVSSWALAVFIRYPQTLFTNEFEILFNGLLVFPAVMISSMIIGGCYRRPVRQFSFDDANRLAVVVTIGWAIGFLGLMGFAERGMSILLAPISCLFLLILLAAPRVVERLYWESAEQGLKHDELKVLIYGAGKAGAALAKWMKVGSPRLKLVGFIDDSVEMQGNKLLNIKVLGRESDIPTIHSVHSIDEVWTTFCLDEIKRTRLRDLCERHQIRLVALADMEPFSRL